MKKILVLSMVAVAAASQAQVWSGAGGAIPDATSGNAAVGQMTSTINAVPGLTSVSAIAILGLTHTFAGDLRAVVTHVPSGTTKVLFSRIGRSSANGLGGEAGESANLGGNYIFSLTGLDFEATAAPFTDTQTVPGGQFFSSDGHAAPTNASTPNGFFPGSYAAGNWTLTVSDWWTGDTGSFQSWEIRGEAVPEPATMAALGLGALALVRRRRAK